MSRQLRRLACLVRLMERRPQSDQPAKFHGASGGSLARRWNTLKVRRVKRRMRRREKMYRFLKELEQAQEAYRNRGKDRW